MKLLLSSLLHGMLCIHLDTHEYTQKHQNATHRISIDHCVLCGSVARQWNTTAQSFDMGKSRWLKHNGCVD